MTSEPLSIKERSQDTPNHRPQTLTKGAGETLQRDGLGGQWPRRPGRTHLTPPTVRRAWRCSRGRASRPAGLIRARWDPSHEAVITALPRHFTAFLVPDASSGEEGNEGRTQQRLHHRGGWLGAASLGRPPGAGPGRPRGFGAPRNRAARDASLRRAVGSRAELWVPVPAPHTRCVRPRPSVRPSTEPSGDRVGRGSRHRRRGVAEGAASLDGAACFATSPCCARTDVTRGHCTHVLAPRSSRGRTAVLEPERGSEARSAPRVWGAASGTRGESAGFRAPLGSLRLGPHYLPPRPALRAQVWGSGAARPISRYSRATRCLPTTSLLVHLAPLRVTFCPLSALLLPVL